MAGGDGGEGSWTAGAAANEVANIGSVILTSLVIRWVASYIAKAIVRPHRRTAQEMQAATARWSSIVFVILFVAFSLYSVSNDLNKMPPNYYQLLGVDKEASSRDVRASYLVLSQKYHPDKNSDPRAPIMYSAIRNAYEIVSHPVKRRVYDIFGATAFEACPTCATYREHLYSSLTLIGIRSAIYTAFVILLLVISNRLYLTYHMMLWAISIAVFELAAVTHGADPLPFILPSLTLPDKLGIVRSLTTTVLVTFAEVYNLLWPYEQTSESYLLNTLQQVLERERGLLLELFQAQTDTGAGVGERRSRPAHTGESGGERRH